MNGILMKPSYTVRCKELILGLLSRTWLKIACKTIKIIQQTQYCFRNNFTTRMNYNISKQRPLYRLKIYSAQQFVTFYYI